MVFLWLLLFPCLLAVFFVRCSTNLWILKGCVCAFVQSMCVFVSWLIEWWRSSTSLYQALDEDCKWIRNHSPHVLHVHYCSIFHQVHPISLSLSTDANHAEAKRPQVSSSKHGLNICQTKHFYQSIYYVSVRPSSFLPTTYHHLYLDFREKERERDRDQHRKMVDF